MRLRDLDRVDWRDIAERIERLTGDICDEADQTALLPEDSAAAEVYHLLNRAGALALICAHSPAAKLSRVREVVAERDGR